MARLTNIGESYSYPNPFTRPITNPITSSITEEEWKQLYPLIKKLVNGEKTSDGDFEINDVDINRIETLKIEKSTGLRINSESLKKITYIKNEFIEKIKKDYPELTELAAEMARLIGRHMCYHEDLSDFVGYTNKIYDLISIIILTEGNTKYVNQYNQAVQEIQDVYKMWDRNYGYVKNNDVTVIRIMKRFYEHMKDKNIPLKSPSEVENDKSREKFEKEFYEEKECASNKMKFDYTESIEDEQLRIRQIGDDILRQFPNLGDYAYEIAKMEPKYGKKYSAKDMLEIIPDLGEFAYVLEKVEPPFSINLDEESKNKLLNCVCRRFGKIWSLYYLDMVFKKISLFRAKLNRYNNIIMMTSSDPRFANEYKDAINSYQRDVLGMGHGLWEWQTYSQKDENCEFAVNILLKQLNEHINDKSKPLLSSIEASGIQLISKHK